MSSSSTKSKPLLLPDTADIIFLLILQLLVFSMPHFVFGDGSTGWHLISGKYILENHAIPHHDLISYTFPHAPWVAYEWLSDVLMSAINQIAGLNGLLVVTSSLIALLFSMLYLRCRQVGGNLFISLLLTICGALGSSMCWLVRPHLFTFFGVFIFTLMLEKFHRGLIGNKKLILWLTVTMLIWANVHPGFLCGFLLVGIYLLSEILLATINSQSIARSRMTTLGLAILTMFIASLINPNGVHLYIYILHYLQGQTVLTNNVEFLSPIFNGSFQSSSLEIVILLSLLALARSSFRPTLPSLLCFLTFLHLALSSIRHVPLFIIIALPFVAELMANARILSGSEVISTSILSKFWNWCNRINNEFTQTEQLCRLHLLPIIVVAILFMAALNSGNLFGQQILAANFDPQSMPTSTLDYIKTKSLPIEHGFTFDNWGGYIGYKYGIPVFIDDRSDFYPQAFYLEYGCVSKAEPGWQKVLNDHKIDWVLFPNNSRLVARLQEDASWKLLCKDQAASLFRRESP